MNTTDNLDFLANDLLTAAAAVLPGGYESRIIGFELAAAKSRIAYFMPEPDGPRCLTSFPATAEHHDALAAADALAVAMLNTMLELSRVMVGLALDEGAKLRVHARPSTGEVATMVLIGRSLVPVGTRTIDTRATLN